MKKLASLIRACMSENMSLFRIRSKKQTQTSKIVIPIILAFFLFFTIWSYANMIMEPLVKVNLEYALLTLFVMITSILTIVEGIYKSSNLLFNCKDDNLLLSLPIKKSTVLFVRIFKLYIFELLYNSLFILPAMIVYIRYVNVGATYYLVSLVALLLLPIIPIIISCIFGGIISAFSSKFKFKNLAQIFVTTVILIGVLYLSFNIESMIANIAESATTINDVITKLYYPAGAYIKLVTQFNMQDLLVFFITHVLLFTAMIFILSKIYFKINSNVKVVKTGSKNCSYKIKTNKPIKALIKKELNKFVSSPVFVTNAGFGLVLYIIGCIGISIKFDEIIPTITSQLPYIDIIQLKSLIAVILFGFICLTSFMSSITSSMISLEGKSFNILKSLPVKPFTILLSKVITAVIIMIPFILIGDIIVFIKFNFNILEIIMILIASIVLPLVSETIGILINLKYPKMNAENDTEVVKQSMSSSIAVFFGMILSGLTIYALFKCVVNNMPADLIILCGLGIYTLIFIGLIIYLMKNGIKEFNNINI